MIIEMTDKDFLEKEIVLKLPKKEINLSKEKKIDELSRSLNLRGFRKGYIPRNIIISRFEKEIDSDILNDLLYKNLLDFLKKNNIVCVKFPSLKTTDYASSDEYAVFIFTFEIYPAINIDFDKMSVIKYKSFISDFDIDFEIERLRKIYGTWEVVDNVSLGDNISFNIFDKNDNIIFSDNNVLVDNTYKKIDGLLDFVLNKKNKSNYFISFYNNIIKEKTGADDLFIFTINTIKRFKIASLESDFYDKINFDGKHDLKSFIRLQLTDVMFNIIDSLFKRDILSSLLLNHDFYIPQSMLDDKKFELKNKDLDKDKDFIIKEVKLNLLLKEIIKRFNIRVSKDEVLQFSSKHYNTSQIDENFYNYIENELFIEKVKEILISKIRVDEKEILFSELLNIGNSL